MIKMQRVTLVAAAGTLVCLSLLDVPAAIAGVKSGKVSSTLTNPANVAGSFTNGTSKGSFSFKGTKANIKAKGTSLANTDGIPCNGDEVICVISLGVNITPPGSVGTVAMVVAGEVAEGTVNASHDFCKDRDEGVSAEGYAFCPETFGALAPVSVSGVTATCYAPTMGWFADNPPSLPLSLTGHACEGFHSGTPPAPAGGIIFTTGSTLIVQ